MEYAFTREQEELRREARAFLGANPDAPLEQLRELGWLGVSVPEERGGGGLSFVDEAILFEEASRALYSGPFLTTAVVLPGLPELDEHTWSIELDGLVPHLGEVDRVLRADGTAVEAAGETLPTVDETRPLGRLGEIVADSNYVEGFGGFEAVRLRLLAGLAVEAVGVAQKALELAVEYVSSREQFGKKIGIYQAVSHPLADAYTRLELSRSLALWAAWCVASDDEQAPLAAAAAKAHAAESAVAVCETAIQVLGGIGFTWEHELHRLYKRALGIESFGTPGTRLRAEVAATLLDAPKVPGSSQTPVAATRGG
jgi:alkylation response protein AidB-like acyl-CoA dehydrogenase